MTEGNVPHSGYDIQVTSFWNCRVIDSEGNVAHHSGPYRSYDNALAAGQKFIDHTLPYLAQTPHIEQTTPTAEGDVPHNGYWIRTIQGWDLEVLHEGRLAHSATPFRSYEEALAVGRRVIDRALPKRG